MGLLGPGQWKSAADVLSEEVDLLQIGQQGLVDWDLSGVLGLQFGVKFGLVGSGQLRLFGYKLITAVLAEKKFPFFSEDCTLAKVASVTLEASTPERSTLVEVTMV